MYHHVKKLMYTVRVDTPDQAVMAAAQKVEHYEISGYGTARTLARQGDLPVVVALLNKSLAEEEVAHNLLPQLARELMSESRAGVGKKPWRRPFAETQAGD